MDKLRIISIIAALGGFLFGYDTGIISGALVFIRHSYTINTLAQECIVSAVVFGALIGAISSGQLADYFGRKFMLVVTALTFIIGTLLSSYAQSVNILIIGRLIIGIAIGITSYTVPLFISEVAPASQRGALVLLNGIMITSGEAIAFLVDYFLMPTQSWRIMFATGLIPAILFFIGMLLVPTSPRWLILKGQIEKARNVLVQVRHLNEIDAEIKEIKQSIHVKTNQWQDLFSKKFKPVLIVGLGLGIFQQFVGINTVMYYGPTIFQAAGLENKSMQILATFGMGLVNTLMSILAVLVIDRIGRRRMLLGGVSVAGISLFLVSMVFKYNNHSPIFIWLMFLLMLIYIAGYSLSLGSLFWLVISEIYPLQIRGFAMSFVTAIQWAANFIVALTFLSILEAIGPVVTFWGYGMMCFISFIFCYYLVPETRGVSLERIEENLRQGKRSRELGEPISSLI